jgi:nucleoside-diphosphate-sugar epimerase
MAHVFVAGATGVLGRRVLPLLLAEGHRVTGLTRGGAGAAAVRAAGAAPVIGDVYDRDGLARLVAAAAPDLVMHQLTDLANGGSDANARMRTTGTRNLVDAAAAAGVRRIVAQSIAWAYEGGQDPADETEPLDLSAPAPRKTTVDGVVAREWVPVFCEAVGAPPPEPVAAGGRTPWARGADNHYAREHLGWVPVHASWRSGFCA